MDAAGELPRQARHTPSTRARPLSLIGAPQGRPSTRRRPSAEPGAPARPPSGSDPRDLRFAEGRIARVGGGAKLSRRCRSSSGLRAPPLRAAAALVGRGYLWLFVLRPAAWTVVECGSKFLGPLLMVSRGTRTARRAGGAGSPQRGAPYVCERGMCAPLSRRHSGRELGMPLNYCTRYHPPKKQKAFRLWIAPRSRRDPRAVLAPVLGARRREHAGSASHRDGVPPLAPAPSARSTSSADTCRRAGTA